MKLAQSLMPAMAIVCMTANVVQAQQDRRIILHNNSSSSICRFHASNTNRGTWEEDILGNKVLRPGQKILINLDDGTTNCWFDFKTVTCDGESIVREALNVCQLETYTLYDD